MKVMNFYAQFDELLTSQERGLVAKAAFFCEGAFSQEVLQAHRESRPFAKTWIDAWARAGFIGLQSREIHGGHEASYICKLRVAQTMAEHSFAAAFAINNLQGSVTRLSRSGTPDQLSHLMERCRSGTVLCAPAMTEPRGGSDLSALATTATPTDGGWLINGTKDWVTNGTIVGCVTLLARIQGGPGDGEIASFLTALEDADTVTREAIDTPGAHSFRLGRLHLRDHFVPHWALFGEPGEAMKSSLAAINAARVHVAAMCVASLHAALVEATLYAESRHAFGKPLIGHQGLRWELAEVAIRMEAAQALVFRAAKLVHDGGAALNHAAMAKKYAVDTAIWGIDQCIRAMGAIGATSTHRLVMLASEVRLSAYGDGTSEMLLDRVGKGLGRHYGPSTKIQ